MVIEEIIKSSLIHQSISIKESNKNLQTQYKVNHKFNISLLLLPKCLFTFKGSKNSKDTENELCIKMDKMTCSSKILKPIIFFV